MTDTPPVARRQPGDRHDRGVMLLALLIGLALSGIALMGAVDVWTLQRQREREQQLLYTGDQYRQAIRRYYYAAPPGTPRTLPVRLELLLEDDRYPIPVRHLRRLYPDPITGRAEWGQLRAGDRIAGVYSLSEARPVKQAGFSAADENFTGRSRYKEWVFSFTGASGAGGMTPIRRLINVPISPHVRSKEAKNEYPTSPD
ncbi:MAG: type II secretion system protein [Rhodoferax sp.]|nr:type II secretion system protein [Rhodoferax sp.]